MADADTQIDPVSVGVGLVTLGTLVCALATLIFIPIPAMLDYVNHLSRMFLLAGPPNPAYAVRFRLCTDMAMDLLVPVLAKLTGVQAAAKIFLGLSQVLVVTGSMALELSAKRRLRLGGPGALLVLFSLPFAWGLMNFMFGLGVATWGVALWIGLRDRRSMTRWLVHAGVVAALFVSHLFDLGVYGLTIGLYELSRLQARPRLGSLAFLVAFMASPVALALAVAAKASGGGVGQPLFHWDAFDLKIAWAFVFMNVYDLRLSMLTAAALLVTILVLVATGRLTLTRSGAWIAAGYAATYLLLPRMMFGTQFQDVRMLTAAGLVLPAFMLTRLPAGLWRRLPAGVLAAIIAVNYTSVAQAWTTDQTDYRQIEASFPLLASRSRVLIGLRDSADRMAYDPLFYAATLAAPDRGVFVSALYSTRGMQPVEPRPEFQSLTPQDPADYKPPLLSVLMGARTGALPPGAPQALRRWSSDYNYLYLVGPAGSNPWPERLVRLAQGRNFALYRIGLHPADPSGLQRDGLARSVPIG